MTHQWGQVPTPPQPPRWHQAAALAAGCQVTITRESAAATTTGAQATSGADKDGRQWP
jgi:hypothetical protein